MNKRHERVGKALKRADRKSRDVAKSRPKAARHSGGKLRRAERNAIRPARNARHDRRTDRRSNTRRAEQRSQRRAPRPDARKSSGKRKGAPGKRG